MLVVTYLVASALGIAGLWVLLGRTGHAVVPSLSEEDARRLAAERFGLGGGKAFATERAVLIADGEGVIVVRRLGSRVHVRRLTPTDLRGAKVSGNILHLRLASYDTPWIALTSEDPDALRAFRTEAGLVPDGTAR